MHYIPLTTLSRESKIALKFNVQILDSEKKKSKKDFNGESLIKYIAKRRSKNVIVESWGCFLLVQFRVSLFTSWLKVGTVFY